MNCRIVFALDWYKTKLNFLTSTRANKYSKPKLDNGGTKFSNSPSNGDIYSANGSTFTYNGTAWIRSTTSSVLAINTTVDPDSNPNSVVAGNIADGSGWGALGIGGNNGTGDSWAIAHNGSNLYMAMGDGSSDDSLQTFLQIEPGGFIRITSISKS